MELLSREINVGADYPESFMPDTPKAVDLFNLLSKVFFLNQEERFKAGIYIGNEGRGWIDKAALILPPVNEE